MKYSTKQELSTTVKNFLRQRRKAYDLVIRKLRAQIAELSPWMGDGSETDARIEELRGKVSHYLNKQATCISILKKFEFIRDWSYWRHCLEVKNHIDHLYGILPSASGGHKAERLHFIDLMDHCNHIASKSYLEHLSGMSSPRGGAEGGGGLSSPRSITQDHIATP